MSKHTPGPWAAHTVADGAYTVYLPEDGMVVCSRNPYESKAAEFEANARLIAAAPELLAALELARAILVEVEHYRADGHSVAIIDAAIAKAEGK